ncbi:MAG: tetratricopeptide repeat protein [Parcubacteria group bacterium]|nr:tetratricopeptide repeat protein [Parcubacteria group bacterium]
MLTIIPLVIVIASMGTILAIASRHLTKAAALDVSQIPEERDAVLKASLLEHRLLRKAEGLFKFLAAAIAPGQRGVRALFSSAMERVRKLERTYRFQGGLPDSSKKAQTKVRELVAEAEELARAGKFANAEAKYLSAIKVDPESTDAYQGLGDTYLAMGEFEQALETFEYYTRQWPQEARGFASLAAVLEAHGKLPEAKDHLLHALSIDNEVVRYHMDLAEVYLRLNDPEKALSSLQKAQALEPNNPKLLDRLFTVSVLLRNKPLAQEVLEKIKKTNPDHGRIAEFEKKVKKLK